MRIGIDIDGVLTDIEQWQFDYISKYYFEEYGKTISNPRGFFTNEIYNSTFEEDNNVWEITMKEYVKEPPRKFANEIIKKLKDKGNEIYIITARCVGLSNLDKYQMEIIVKDWLKKYNIYYDKIIFSPEDKLEICLENKIDIMIDDSPINVTKISKKLPVICFNALYNEHCKRKKYYKMLFLV